MGKSKYLRSILFGALLVGFTLFVILDAFVLPRKIDVEPQGNGVQFPSATTDSAKETENVRETESEEENGSGGGREDGKEDGSGGGNKSDGKNDGSGKNEEETEGNNSDRFSQSDSPVSTENSYQDSNIRITITETRYCDTNVYIAEVELSSAEYLKTAFAEGQYGKNITAKTSETAEENDAIFAVNGDYYGARNSGYVIRNGYLYRDEVSDQEALVIYPDGSMEVVKESEVSAQSLLDKGAYHVLSFGPGLVTDGAVDIDPEYETGRAATKNPRTAIGMISPLHYVFVVTDGRSDDSDGLTIRELAELMVDLGAQCAYNLDGGGSSTMYFNGEVINDPSSGKGRSKERSVSDIVYIG